MCRSRRIVLLCISAIFMFGGVRLSAETITFRVMGWNVESGGSDADTIAQRIADEDGVHLWGLSEVNGENDAKKFEAAAEKGESGDFKRIVGTTGGADRLVILYDSDKLRFLTKEELHHINIGGRVRAPLVARFEGKTTGQQFLVTVNHLYRSKPQERHKQATLLNQWARNQDVPIIALGDWNFDWHVQSGDVDHDEGYDNLTKDDVFIWVRPDVLHKTQDSNFNSVLDFVFVAGEASGWSAESTIILAAGDFPDDNTTSDHRPVDCVFTLDTDIIGRPTSRVLSDDELLERINEMEEELRQLRRDLESRR